MKKTVMMLISVVFATMLLAGCTNPFKQDNNYAKVSLTTSNGFAANLRSYNGSGKDISGSEFAFKCQSRAKLKKGDVLYLSFKCDACGDKQEFEIHEPWAQTLSCQCPEEMDKEGNAREYFSLSVTVEE